jgi:hypothetical protein
VPPTGPPSPLPAAPGLNNNFETLWSENSNDLRIFVITEYNSDIGKGSPLTDTLCQHFEWENSLTNQFMTMYFYNFFHARIHLPLATVIVPPSQQIKCSRPFVRDPSEKMFFLPYFKETERKTKTAFNSSKPRAVTEQRCRCCLFLPFPHWACVDVTPRVFGVCVPWQYFRVFDWWRIEAGQMDVRWQIACARAWHKAIQPMELIDAEANFKHH